MKIQEVKFKKPQGLESKPSLFSVPEAFRRIKIVLEKSKMPTVVGELQKEKIVPAIRAILSQTELFGQILPFGWENLSLGELERLISMAEILWKKPFYIV